MIQTEDKWRTQELPGRREVREILVAQPGTQLEKKDRTWRRHEEKRVLLEDRYQLDLIQHQQHTTLLPKLFRSNRTHDETHQVLWGHGPDPAGLAMVKICRL